MITRTNWVINEYFSCLLDYRGYKIIRLRGNPMKRLRRMLRKILCYSPIKLNNKLFRPQRGRPPSTGFKQFKPIYLQRGTMRSLDCGRQRTRSPLKWWRTWWLCNSCDARSRVTNHRFKTWKQLRLYCMIPWQNTYTASGRSIWLTITNLNRREIKSL